MGGQVVTTCDNHIQKEMMLHKLVETIIIYKCTDLFTVLLTLLFYQGIIQERKVLLMNIKQANLLFMQTPAYDRLFSFCLSTFN